MKAFPTLLALSFATALLAGCGVGPYHIPDVPPVVMPEPEEDLFADLDMGGDEPAPSEAPPPEEPAPEPAEEPAPAAEEPKAPAPKKK
jgi:hypothetical protein